MSPPARCRGRRWWRAGRSGTSAADRFSDIDGDGKADYVVVDDDNGLRAWRNAGGDGRGGWPAYGRIAGGFGNGSSGRIRI